MGLDLLGDLFGKARRRKLEMAAMIALTGGTKPVAIDYAVLGTRLAAGATAALLTATLNHSLPATAGGILTVAGIGLTGALPTALKSSGILTALSPNTLSAVQGLGQTVSAVLAAPANAKKAAFQAAVADEVNKVLEKTGQFGPDELAPAPAPQDRAETPTGAQGSIVGQGSITASDAAITATGGNQ